MYFIAHGAPMSTAAIEWATRQRIVDYREGKPRKRSSARHLLIIMAELEQPQELNPDVSEVKAPIDLLVELTGQNPKTVYENLKRLKELKYIQVVGRCGLTNQIRVYALKRTDADAIERADLQVELSAQASTGETREEVVARAEIEHNVETRYKVLFGPTGVYPRRPGNPKHFKSQHDAEESDRLAFRAFKQWNPDDSTIAIIIEHISMLLKDKLYWREKDPKGLPWAHTYIQMIMRDKDDDGFMRSGKWVIPPPMPDMAAYVLKQRLSDMWPPEYCVKG